MKKRFWFSLSILTITLMAGFSGGCKAKLKTSAVPQVKTVAIATLMSHPALDEVRKGIVDELRREGYEDGKTIHLIVRNANGQVQLASNIAAQLAAIDPAVTVAITTPMAQAVAKTARGPVVFAAVTDPVGAGLVQSVDRSEERITGTSDAWPYEDQLHLIHRITPNVRRIGVLYNPGEAASQYGIKQIRRYAAAQGLTIVEGAVSSTNDVYGVALQLATKSDALMLSSDNTVIGGRAAAVKVAVEKKIPLYVGDSGTVEGGGLATVSVGYAQLGTETGKLVVRMLRGERNIKTVVARGDEVYVNAAAAAGMGVNVPDDVLKSAKQVFQTIRQ